MGPRLGGSFEGDAVAFHSRVYPLPAMRRGAAEHRIFFLKSHRPAQAPSQVFNESLSQSLSELSA
jgi:hypothetical protein